MEIHYLQKLKDNSTIFQSKMRGVSEKEIKEFEKQTKVKFPKSYKEYLYLAGDYDGDLMMLRGYSGMRDLERPKFRKFIESYKKKAGVNIKRPHWDFTGEEDGFYFFYLDENTEDPKIYSCEWAFGEVEIESYYDLTFSEFINSLIDNSKAHYKGLYR